MLAFLECVMLAHAAHLHTSMGSLWWVTESNTLSSLSDSLLLDCLVHITVCTVHKSFPSILPPLRKNSYHLWVNFLPEIHLIG